MKSVALHSFYRYSTHVGLLNLAALWVCAPLLGRQIKTNYPALFLPQNKLSLSAQRLIIIAALFTLPLALYLHRGLAGAGGGAADICAYRDQGKIIAAALPPQSRLGVLDPDGDGLIGYVINFELALNEAQHNVASRRHLAAPISSRAVTKLADAQQRMDSGTLNALFVSQAKNQPLHIMDHDNQGAPLLLIHTVGGLAINLAVHALALP